MVGRKIAQFTLWNQGGDLEEYKFVFRRDHMLQTNVANGKERKMRAPWGMTPPKAQLPEGDMIVITLRGDQVGKSTIEVRMPKGRGAPETLTVAVPAKAKAGQKLAIPIPNRGESIDALARRQQDHNSKLSAGGKVAAIGKVTVAAGACVLGGVILGDHLAGGTLAQDVAEGVADAGEAIGDAIGAAAADVGDWAEDAGVTDWVEGAADDVGDFAEDVGDWLGDAGEDAGDWICSVFG